MRSIFRPAAFLFLLLTALSPRGSAQDDTTKPLHKLTLTDGSEVVGTIESEHGDTVYFRTLSNVPMAIPRGQLKGREQLGGTLVSGEYQRPDPNHTRLFFAPTARSLKGGQGYFSVAQIFFPFVAVGVADFLTLGGGISLFPGATNQLLYLAPKITPLHLGNFDLAGGVLYINSTGAGGEGVGIAYGVSTLGTSRAALTFGLGWGFIRGELSDEPVILVGGELRMSNSAKLISENWIPPNSDFAILSLGVRFFGENLAADFGFIHFTGSDIEGFPFLPWISFAYNFGSQR